MKLENILIVTNGLTFHFKTPVSIFQTKWHQELSRLSLKQTQLRN